MKTHKLSVKCFLFCSLFVNKYTLCSSTRIIYRQEYSVRKSLLRYASFRCCNRSQLRNDLQGYSSGYLCKVVAPISRKVISTPSRDFLDRKTKIARRCSFWLERLCVPDVKGLE
ncbi:hypothetical protein Gasu2_57440 [Galdieria sulphuraria]|nr:hypothetical protein Gasu2_57440 [Galdieria sulphuraria]